MISRAGKEIETTAQRIFDMTMYNANKFDCVSVAEFVAYEILDLTELMCSDFTIHDRVIKEVLKQPSLSEKTKQIIREMQRG